MIIKVKVKPGSKNEEINKTGENEYDISLKERAEDGRANVRLVNLLSNELGVSFKDIRIKNPKSRKKIIEIKGK